MRNETGKENEMKPADITLSTLGGRNRLKAMIGARDFFSDDDGKTLTFKFKMCPKANYIRITLNGLDYYDIEFKKIGRLNRKTWNVPVKTTGEFENVPVENLRSTIEDFTGLYLSLGTMGAK